MGTKKKVNPNRQPVSYRDVKEARVEGAEFMFTVIIHVLKDKIGLGNEDLLKIGPAIDYFCDSIRRGYVKYDDLRKAQLDEGYSVHIRVGMKEFVSRQLPDGEYEIKIDGVTLPETYPAEEIGTVYAEHWGDKQNEALR